MRKVEEPRHSHESIDGLRTSGRWQPREFTDDHLADVIRSDALALAERGTRVELRRYLDLIPDLPKREVPLDAAIDVALRALSGSEVPSQSAVSTLLEAHADLAGPVLEAAALSRAMGGADAETLIAAPHDRVLPSPFGPVMPNGARRYVLTELLGSGAHGTVYRAVDRVLSDATHEAIVAIKLMARRASSVLQRQRLIDEAAKARRVSHVNVVSVLDRGVDDTLADYIVYEFVSGGSLEKHLPSRESKEDVRNVVRLMAQVSRGVHAAHFAGLVHCDLKPSNILLSDGSPKVADFGIARRVTDLGADAFHATYDGPLGNIAFISPEQYRLEPGSISASSDIFALGGILYFLLAGTLPNGSSAREIERTHDAEHGRKSPPLLSDAVRHSDDDLDAICAKAMAVNPADRYPSAAHFADDLERWLAREVIPWRKPGVVRRLKLWSIRRPLAAIGAGALVVALLVGTIGGVSLAIANAKEESRRLAGEQMRALGDRLKAANVPESSISLLWFLEQINGDSLLGAGQFDEVIWDARFDYLRPRVERAYAEGRGRSVENLTRETTLVFWMLTDPDDHPDAQTVIRRNRESWESLIPRDDRLFVRLDVISNCAAIKSVWFSQKGKKAVKSPQRDTLLQAVDALKAYVNTAPEEEMESPIRVLALRALGRAYETTMLNDAAEQKRWRALYTEHGTH